MVTGGTYILTALIIKVNLLQKKRVGKERLLRFQDIFTKGSTRKIKSTDRAKKPSQQIKELKRMKGTFNIANEAEKESIQL